MRYEAGNQYGKHDNHYKGGRLTKEQQAELSGLVPKSIAAWRYILDKDANSIEWCRLKSTVAKDVLMKFVADLTETENKTDYSDSVKEFISDISSRISGLNASTGTATSISDKSSELPTAN